MKQTIKITKQDCTEQLTGVPVPIVQRMVECQVEQGNPANIAVFQRNINACLHMGGFNWGDTKEGYASWYNTLMDKEFSKFITKYLTESSNPKPSPEEHELQAMAKIKEAFIAGEKLTTAQGNRLAHTVDFRKIVSRLRKNGMVINDTWSEHNGHRFKVYFL